MAIIKGIDPESHENLLAISLPLLRNGMLSRNELKERMRRIQETKWSPNFKHHEYRTYDKWIRVLVQRGIVERLGDQVKLTDLGRWIANSNLGDIFERDSFLDTFICKRCSSYSRVVLLTPLLETINENWTNIKGEIFVDLRCPKCEAVSPPTHLGPKNKLIEFYNRAVRELEEYVSLEAQQV
jgi:hypothetical protein